mmetsp:Transcript_27667/g.89367  ORF Transcript_27667/g.89367 Transcript_27667/m.89367 type:complete len:217 (+) Transcript_27667:354-1004(+)
MRALLGPATARRRQLLRRRPDRLGRPAVGEACRDHHLHLHPRPPLPLGGRRPFCSAQPRLGGNPALVVGGNPRRCHLGCSRRRHCGGARVRLRHRHTEIRPPLQQLQFRHSLDGRRRGIPDNVRLARASGRLRKARRAGDSLLVGELCSPLRRRHSQGATGGRRVSSRAAYRRRKGSPASHRDGKVSGGGNDGATPRSRGLAPCGCSKCGAAGHHG